MAWYTANHGRHFWCGAVSEVLQVKAFGYGWFLNIAKDSFVRFGSLEGF